MSTEAQLKSISNTQLASGAQIPALKHRTVNNAIIEEMYEAQSRGDVLAGVQSAVSLAGSDQVLVIRSGQAYLLDATEFGFVDALADLTDVSFSALSDDQILVYDTSVNRWVNKFISDVVTGGVISGFGTVGTIPVFTDSRVLDDSLLSQSGGVVTLAGDLTLTGSINSGTANDFVKGDGSLDSTDYQGQIDAEEAARIASDNTLQSNIDSEAATRLANDNTLQANIDTEEAARISADAVLQGGIDAEGLTRQYADADLQSQIDSNDTDISNLQSSKQDISEKNQANGYAPLDSGAKIPIANLPDSVVGQVEYQGTWNASTDTPTLPAASGVKGHYYVTSVGGTYETIVYAVGDWIISNGTSWDKVDNTDAVTSVFGRLGNVVANAGDYDAFYVNLNGNQTITGEKTFSGDSLLIADAGNGLKGRFKNSSIGSVQDSGYATLGFNGSNNLFFTKATSANLNGGIFAWDNDDAIRTYTLQDASGTLAFTSDLDDYVTLNTAQTITAEKTFNNSGSDSNIIVNHTSGSGIALDITKSGDGEGLRINKTSGSGNALTVTGDAELSGDLTVDTDTLFVDASTNRVGIGTTSPWENLSLPFDAGLSFGGATYPLTISRSSAGQLITTIADGYDSSTTRIDFVMRNGHAEQNTALSITGSGNVGIGTTSPDYPLHIRSTLGFPVIIERTNAADAGIRFKDSTTTDADQVRLGARGNDLQILTGGSESVRIDSSGAISFAGSSSLSSAVASIQHLSSNGYLYIRGGTGGLILGDDGTDSRIQIENNSNIRFETAGSERMRIDSSGNVSISTGSLTTGAPSGSTARPIKIGDITAPPSGQAFITDSANALRVDINGTLYYLALADPIFP